MNYNATCNIESSEPQIAKASNEKRQQNRRQSYLFQNQVHNYSEKNNVVWDNTDTLINRKPGDKHMNLWANGFTAKVLRILNKEDDILCSKCNMKLEYTFEKN